MRRRDDHTPGDVILLSTLDGRGQSLVPESVYQQEVPP